MARFTRLILTYDFYFNIRGKLFLLRFYSFSPTGSNPADNNHSPIHIEKDSPVFPMYNKYFIYDINLLM